MVDKITSPVTPLEEINKINELIDGKQDALTSANAGTGISIVNGVISTTSGNPEWGSVTGTLSNQTDLQSALNAKANDADVVKLTGNQTIAGAKTFTGAHVMQKSASDNNGNGFVIQDSNNIGNVKLLEYVTANGTHYARILNSAYSKNAYIDITITPSGNRAISLQQTDSVYAPTPDTSDNSTKIATTAFVKAQGYLTSHQSLSNYVTLNSAQTITGAKTFSGNIVKADKEFICTDVSPYGQFRAIGGNYGFFVRNDGSNTYFMLTNSGDQYGSYNSLRPLTINNSTGYVTTITPATSDNSTKIATTAYVKNQGYVTNSSLATCHVVVTTYVNGANWYRVWSDGWIEQGGLSASWLSGNNAFTVTLIKAFSNTNYTVSLTETGSIQDQYTGGISLKSKTTNDFVVNPYTNNHDGISWYACGY